MNPPYHHIYLSPHFDDAALSVGGTIAQQTAAGERVLVITICSAPPREPLNAFAAYLHEQWGNAADPIGVRRSEDQEAVRILGADLLFLDDLDAIYRHPAYDSSEAIFGTPVDDDPLVARLSQRISELMATMPDAIWYAPLAIGNHVDHQLTHNVAWQLVPSSQMIWYEDLPYSTKLHVRDLRLAALPPLTPIVHDISDTLPIKLDAVAAYASQMLELFGDEATMRSNLSNYATSVAPAGAQAGERLWQRKQDS